MNNSPNLEGARSRWPLRSLLAILLIVLLSIGVVVKRDDGVNAPATTTTVPSSTTTTAPVTGTSKPSTTTTTPITTTTRATPPPSGPIAQAPVSNPTDFNDPQHGCGFAMSPSSNVAASSTTSTTSTSTTTSSTSSTTTTPTTTTTTATTTTVPSTHVSVIGHCTVLEIGDSLGNDLGWGLQRQLAHAPGLRLVQKDKSSSGLANTTFYDWPARLKTLLAQYHPDLTIICLGGNDEQGFIEDGHAVEFPTEAWKVAYSARIRQIVTMATQAQSYVLWVGMPIMEPTQYREGMVVLNKLYESVSTSIPGGTFLPTWDLFANAQGQFQMAAQIGPTRQILRASDGIHFSYVGENVLATYVADAMASLYHVAIHPEAPTRINS